MNEKQNLFNAWYELARTMTPETLGALGKTLRNSVQDSQDLIHATVAMMDAAAYAMVKDLNVGEEFMYLLSVLAFRHINNMGDGYTTILNYDEMLDPSKRKNFEKTIPEHVFLDLQQKAQELLESNPEDMHPAQRKHLENILKGRVPFGYTILEEDMVTDPTNYEVRKPEEHVCEDEECHHEEELHVEEEPEMEIQYDEAVEEDIMPPYITNEEEILNEEPLDYETKEELLEPEYVEDDYDPEVMDEQPMDDYDEMDYIVDDEPMEETIPQPIEDDTRLRRRAIKRISREPEPVVEEDTYTEIEDESVISEELNRDEGLSLAEALTRLTATRAQLE